jgi:hypothetical protein
MQLFCVGGGEREEVCVVQCSIYTHFCFINEDLLDLRKFHRPLVFCIRCMRF